MRTRVSNMGSFIASILMFLIGCSVVTTTLASVDLQFTEIEIDQETPYANETIYFNVKFKNAGTSTSGPFRVHIYLGGSPIPRTRYYASLGPGGFRAIWEIYRGIDLKAGTTYRARFVIDEANEVIETNEANNYEQRDITVYPFIPTRKVQFSPHSNRWKQGDVAEFGVSVGDFSNVENATYTIKYYDRGNLLRTSTQPIISETTTLSVNTCKTNGSNEYLTHLQIVAEATYSDGFKRKSSYLQPSLTTSHTEREDYVAEYGVYVADVDFVDELINVANSFMNRFDSFDVSQYYYAEPHIYKGSSHTYVDAVDFAISLGHGSHHNFVTGSGGVNMSTTSFGGCADCYKTGDLEYLIFLSCQTLSMDNSGGRPYYYNWIHEENTKFDKRPFQGLHGVLGFRTNVRLGDWLLDNDGKDLFETFADYLDSGYSFRNAWMDSIEEELSFSGGDNRGAVFYQNRYETENIQNIKHNPSDDHIYGYRWAVESWQFTAYYFE